MSKEERKARRSARRQRAKELLGLYLEDLLLGAAGICFTAAAALAFGGGAALCTAGVCLTVYALAVARAAAGRR